MATLLVVTAHPEPRSFTAQWARATARHATAAGHTVLTSDLCARNFDPVEHPRHFAQPPNPFDALKAQEGPLPPDVAAETAKIRAADLIVLHFPLWWFAPPAILKGWTERCLPHGHLHDTKHRFDTGLLSGKRVLFRVTTGSNAAESGPGGREGDTRLLLWPLAATFRYCGLTVLEPQIVHGVHGYHRDDRKTALEARLTPLIEGPDEIASLCADRPAIPFNADAQFDAEGRLQPGAPSHSPFIRR